MAGKNEIGQSCDGFTRRRLRDVGQDEKGEELTQQKCEYGERASGLSRGTEERKKTGEKTRERESLLYSEKTHLQQIELYNK